MTDIDWIWNRLVTGPDAALNDFIDRAQGPGFVPWRWPGGEDRDYWAALALQGGAHRRWRPTGWRDALPTISGGLSVTRRRVPVDLHALRPVARKVRYAGWHCAGAEWCWTHWGTRWPLRRVMFTFEHRRQKRNTGIEVVAVYEFLSGDWSPWRALATCQRKWPALQFSLQPVIGR